VLRHQDWFISCFGIAAVDGVMAGSVAVGIVAAIVVAFVILSSGSVTVDTDHCDSWRCILLLVQWQLFDPMNSL